MKLTTYLSQHQFNWRPRKGVAPSTNGSFFGRNGSFGTSEVLPCGKISTWHSLTAYVYLLVDCFISLLLLFAPWLSCPHPLTSNKFPLSNSNFKKKTTQKLLFLVGWPSNSFAVPRYSPFFHALNSKSLLVLPMTYLLPVGLTGFPWTYWLIPPMSFKFLSYGSWVLKFPYLHDYYEVPTCG